MTSVQQFLGHLVSLQITFFRSQPATEPTNWATAYGPDNWGLISCTIRDYPTPRHIQSVCGPCPAFYPTGTALCSQYLTLIASTLIPLCVSGTVPAKHLKIHVFWHMAWCQLLNSYWHFTAFCIFRVQAVQAPHIQTQCLIMN